MKGRATGSPELEKAADYIAKQFRSIGLKPVEGDSYFQAFAVTTNARLGHDNRFEYTERGKTSRLKTGEDFIPFNFSSRGKVTGSVVFVGYGITAPEYHYDDYDGLDVKDKLVLILRHEPQEFDEHSVFDGKVYTEHAQFASKATNAKNHGARGVILVNDTFSHRGEPDDLEKFERAGGAWKCGHSVRPDQRRSGGALDQRCRDGTSKTSRRPSTATSSRNPSHCPIRLRSGRTSMWSAWSRRCTTWPDIFPEKPMSTLSSARTTITWDWAGSTRWRHCRRESRFIRARTITHRGRPV